jgi:RNA polymerase sigma factor (sigma-70 family)
MLRSLMAFDAAPALRRHRLLPAPLLRVSSDQRLVEHVRAGSERAFELLFDRHHRSVLAFCTHMLGSRYEAEDAAQQTFLTAYRELVHTERPIALRPWLYAIARHRCLTMLRARREHPVADVSERAATYQLAAELDTREELRAVLVDLARLPDDQRAALVLSQLDDLSHDEIARILGCPRDKVRAIVFQARSALSASRAARDTPCAEIREQLATLRGGSLRRALLRRHVYDCPGCRAFRDQMRAQRRALGLLLPVTPALGLKRAVLGTVLGSGGGGGGALVGASALGGAVAATALVAVAVPVGQSHAGAAAEPVRPATVAAAGAPPLASAGLTADSPILKRTRANPAARAPSARGRSRYGPTVKLAAPKIRRPEPLPPRSVETGAGPGAASPPAAIDPAPPAPAGPRGKPSEPAMPPPNGHAHGLAAPRRGEAPPGKPVKAQPPPATGKPDASAGTPPGKPVEAQPPPATGESDASPGPPPHAGPKPTLPPTAVAAVKGDEAHGRDDRPERPPR